MLFHLFRKWRTSLPQEHILKTGTPGFTALSYQDYLSSVINVAAQLDRASSSTTPRYGRLSASQHQLMLPGEYDDYIDHITVHEAEAFDSADPEDLDFLFENLEISEADAQQLQANYANRGTQGNACQGTPRRNNGRQSNGPNTPNRPYGPSVDARTFRGFSESDKRAWDAISPEG